jgi:hypothetical protein
MHGEELDSSRDGGGKTSLLRVGKGRYFIEGIRYYPNFTSSREEFSSPGKHYFHDACVLFLGHSLISLGVKYDIEILGQGFPRSSI